MDRWRDVWKVRYRVGGLGMGVQLDGKKGGGIDGGMGGNGWA